MATRFVIEGIWSGYHAGQRKVCHRSVTVRQSLADALRKIHTIEFTDNTTMEVSVREAAKREKVEERKAYCELLEEAARSGKTGFVRVLDLN